MLTPDSKARKSMKNALLGVALIVLSEARIMKFIVYALALFLTTELAAQQPAPDPRNPELASAASRGLVEKNKQLVDELLTPAQWKRLRQIAFQVEIARIGLGKALTEGRFSPEVGIHENQKTHIVEKAEEIEARTAETISRLLANAQRELLSELAPEQRAKAVDAMGEPFFFRDEFRPKMGTDSKQSTFRPAER